MTDFTTNIVHMYVGNQKYEVKDMPLTEPITNLKFFFGDRDVENAPVLISNLRYTPNLLYPGNIFASTIVRPVITQLENWPPSKDWFVKFNFIIQNRPARNEGWAKILWFVKHWNGYQHLPLFQINRYTMSLFVYFSSQTNPNRRHLGDAIDLRPYIGQKLSMEFTFKETSTGVYAVGYNFNNGAVIHSSIDNERYQSFNNVDVSYGSSPSIMFLVSDIEYGELM
uniref:Uncharacterized protein n=1 Tax=Clytia hemisphaerica TaxID=252671 RepID=A0A7M5X6X3_9CNID